MDYSCFERAVLCFAARVFDCVLAKLNQLIDKLNKLRTKS